MRKKRTIVIILTSFILTVALFVFLKIKPNIFLQASNQDNQGTKSEMRLSGMKKLANAKDATDPGLLSAVKFVDGVALYLGGAALDDQGGVWMWGYNAWGMQGIGIAQSEGGTARYQGGFKRLPYFVNNNIKIKKIWGAYHTMYAQAENGKMYAWGNGSYGNMANGTVTGHNTSPVEMTAIPDGEVVKELYVGPEEGHAVYCQMESGKFYAWGRREAQRIPNSFLSVGGGIATGVTGSQISIPQLLKPLTELHTSDPIVSMSIGDNHGLLVTKSGKVYSWGYNGVGQLGTGNTISDYNLKEVSFFTKNNLKAIQASANTSDSLILCEDGTVYNFGALKIYNYGDTAVTTPTIVPVDLTSANYTPIFKKVTAGKYAEFAIDQYGRVWTWGSNGNYQYGVDGPGWGTEGDNMLYHFDNVNYGKYNKYLTKATQIPSVLGDGDTENRTNGSTNSPSTPVKAPIFDNFTTSQITDVGTTLRNWRQHGMWSNYAGGDGKHPTIYDKRYYQTSGTLGTVPIGPSDVQQAASHDKVYFVDDQGRRLVYVILRTGTTTSNYKYSGNFYVADDTYTGSWFVNQSGIADQNASTANATLPSGVTSETALPAVKEEEKGWIEAVTGGERNDFTGNQNAATPYAINILTFQSNMMLIDKAGNLYRTSGDGSGSIAWGWDYIPQYDQTGGTNNYGDGNGVQARHQKDGLFDFYCYELMFMRGAPRISPTYVKMSSPIQKIYKSQANQQQITDLQITLGTATVSESMGITINPELSQAKYVKIPYDPSDSNATIAEPTQAEFEAAYKNSAYEDKGDLIDLNGWTAADLVNNSPDKSKKLEDAGNIVVKDNCILWVMTVTSGYSANVATVSRAVYDNYYTDTKVYHDGKNANPPKEKIYSATDKYIVKTQESKDSADEDMTIYGMPLDKKGNIIIDPQFGYDEVSVRAFANSDAEYDEYINGWYLLEANGSPVKYVLNDDNKYKLTSKFTHTFKYERDPAGWVTITYKGRFTETTTNISPYVLDGLTGNEGIVNNQETVKKTTSSVTVTLTRQPAAVSNASATYFTVNGGTNQAINEDGTIRFATISDRDLTDMEIVIYYQRAELYVRQVIMNINHDLVIPSKGYFQLVNTDGKVATDRYNMNVYSGNSESDVKFKKVKLTTSALKAKYTIEPTIPEMYRYYGYRISTTESAHSGSTFIQAPNEVLIDYSTGSKYYVTVYLEPVYKAVIPYYNWDYKLNSFGEIR